MLCNIVRIIFADEIQHVLQQSIVRIFMLMLYRVNKFFHSLAKHSENIGIIRVSIPCGEINLISQQLFEGSFQFFKNTDGRADTCENEAAIRVGRECALMQVLIQYIIKQYNRLFIAGYHQQNQPRLGGHKIGIVRMAIRLDHIGCDK